MNDKFLIKGLAGKKNLSGRIKVNGAKNAVLKVMASSFLFRDPLSISNVPEIEDVERMIELLLDLGMDASRVKKNKLLIEPKNLFKSDIDPEIAKRMRSSISLVGPILARFGQASFPHPGGCVIGSRPIDLFLDGFKKMGATVKIKGDKYHIKADKGVLEGAKIFFRIPSVTATETFMMAGVLAKGITVIKNAAMEPEIVSLADFLISCGAKIKGAGTPTIEVIGGGLLHSKGRTYKTIPDRMETGSFLILGALAASDLEIIDCDPTHLEIVVEMLKDSGVPIEVGKNFIKIVRNTGPNRSFRPINIKTHEYPGFPTDLQAPMSVFLTQVSGESLVFETIFEGRLNYTQDLVKMGADITMWDPHRVMIKGPTNLSGSELDGPDLRAGLAFILAGIIANKSSVINNVYYIDRGYERIEERLQEIGVKIERSL